MKIYTKTGDDGETGLFGGPRVAKNHPRIEAYGTLDELNSVLGCVRAELTAPDARQVPPIFAYDLNAGIQQIQNDLFLLGAELATPDPSALSFGLLAEPAVTQLEAWIDRHEATLPALSQFILPGGTRLASQLHLSRTVCRRAERRIVDFDGDRKLPLIYLNRLSDLLFVLARAANQAANEPDVPWQSPRKG